MGGHHSEKKKLTQTETSDTTRILPGETPEIRPAFRPFSAPELFSDGLNSDWESPEEPDDSDSDPQSGLSAWDIAVRYHEFKTQASRREMHSRLRRISARAILDRARNILGSVVRPEEPRISPLSELPSGAERAEIDLEATLDEAPVPVTRGAWSRDELQMQFRLPRRQPVILSVDTSLSMTGEKLALTAVALAVVLLQFPEDPIGIVAFENEAKVLKHPDEPLSIGALIERFLDVPAQGYTHLEDGLRASLHLTRSLRISGARPPSTVLLTDGKYTAGKDPAYLAPRFAHLIVMKMGHERASLQLCEELALKGHGVLREVGELESLPWVMYGVVKDLLRGKSG